jgi:2-amino-4-hydroxy-6-hydroxymethyldihydropteridine diphosphokinase
MSAQGGVERVGSQGGVAAEGLAAEAVAHLGDPARGALVFVGLGSNQGDPAASLADAIAGLGALPGTSLVACSSVYRTAAVGYVDQPDFLNQVVALQTTLAPLELLEAGQALEARAHRERTVRWGPRTLDIDILWYDGMTLGGTRLSLPHPRLEERRFVLEPLAELAPALRLASGRTALEALALVADQIVVRRDEAPGPSINDGQGVPTAVGRGASAVVASSRHDDEG